MKSSCKTRNVKNKFEQYRDLLKEIKQLEKEICALTKKKEHVPVIKDKVQASMSEFPYTLTHVTVDAYDPLKATTIDRKIIKRRHAIDDYNMRAIEIEEAIDGIEDSITRQIFRAVYLEGRTQTAIALELNIDQSSVSRLINKELAKHA